MKYHTVPETWHLGFIELEAIALQHVYTIEGEDGIAAQTESCLEAPDWSLRSKVCIAAASVDQISHPQFFGLVDPDMYPSGCVITSGTTAFYTRTPYAEVMSTLFGTPAPAPTS